MPRKTEAKKCVCGCGKMTAGGDFLPGHDAKHKSRLIEKAARGGETAGSAIQELKMRGWFKFLVAHNEKIERDAELKKEREALKAQKKIDAANKPAKAPKTEKTTKKSIVTEAPLDIKGLGDVEIDDKVAFKLGRNSLVGVVSSAFERGDGVPMVRIAYKDHGYVRELIEVSKVTVS